MPQTSTTAHFMRADIAFHATLVHAAGDPALLHRWPALATSLRCVGVTRPVERHDIIASHERILATVRAGDAMSAEREARRHVTTALTALEGRLS